MEVLDLGQNYKNAENCSSCPKRNDEEGCPFWWEFIQTNTQSGQERLVKQCGKSAMHIIMVEVIKASNRPASAVESTRNEIVRGFDMLAQIAQQKQAPQLKTGVVGFVKKMLGSGN